MVADIGSPSAYHSPLAGGAQRHVQHRAVFGIVIASPFASASRKRLAPAQRQQRVDGLAVQRCRVKVAKHMRRLQPQAFRPLIGIAAKALLSASRKCAASFL